MKGDCPPELTISLHFLAKRAGSIPVSRPGLFEKNTTPFLSRFCQGFRTASD